MTLVINIVPCHIEANGTENIDIWKSSNSKTNKQTPIPPTKADEATFTPVYDAKNHNLTHENSQLHTSYLRGRRLFGEKLNLPDSSIAVFEKKGDLLLKKNEASEIIVWEHEKVVCEAQKLENGFENQWGDIPEMMKVAEILHS